MIYKFKMLLEDNEDFVRDFEIQSGDSFGDFHNLINKHVKLGSDELASFFVCDSHWSKLEEITLIDMSSETDDNEDEQEGILPPVMKDVILKDKVTDPHQRFVYEYDFLNTKTFYIELVKIGKKVPGVKYPKCTYKKEDIGSVIKNTKIIDVDEEALLEDFNDLLKGNDSGFEIDEYSDSDF